MTVIRRRGRPNRSQNNNLAPSNRREVRYRDKYVEAFHANTRVNQDHAYYDRLELTLEAFKLHFNDREELQRFRDHFAQNGIIRPDSNSFNPYIRDEWLFSGRVFITNIENIEDIDNKKPNQKDIIKRVQYRFILNPSRFVHHAFQKLGRDPEEFSLSRLEQFETRELLTKEEIDPVHLSLDENDNYIPNDIFKLARPFQDYFRLYLNSIIEMLRRSILESMEYALQRPVLETDAICHENNWILTSSEVYWEYSVNDALSFVNGLWDGFQAVLYKTERREYRATETIEAGQRAARTGRQQLMNGIALYANDFGAHGLRLVLYAKRHKRIRFEMRYHQSARRLFSNDFKRTLTTDLESLYDAMSEYTRTSERRLTRMIRALPDLAYSERAEYHVFADFLVTLAEVHRQIPHLSLRHTFSQLANTGRIIVHLDTDEHRAMELLKEEYIVTDENSAYLRHDDDTKIYALTSRYLNIMRGFREVFRAA